MEQTIFVTTPAELQSCIERAINSLIPKLADYRKKDEAVERDVLTLPEASKYFAEVGYPLTRASLYNLIFKKAIPYNKVGKRVIFSKRELREWLDGRTVSSTESRDRAAQVIVDSIKRKTSNKN